MSEILIFDRIECKLKDDLPLTKKLLELNQEIEKFDERTHRQKHSKILDMQRYEDDIWTFRLFIADENYRSPRSLNQRINKIGKEIFGRDNFQCSPSFSSQPDGGTGWLTLNYHAMTRCKVKWPETRDEGLGGYEKYLKSLGFEDKENVYLIDTDSIIANFKFPITQFHQSFHEEGEDLYWKYCDYDYVLGLHKRPPM